VVEGAADATMIVVAAHQGASAIGLWLVRPGTPGVTIEPAAALDFTSRPTYVSLNDVDAERLVHSSMSTYLETGQRAAVLAAAGQVGLARRAIDSTVDYAESRVQFGRPIGSFQAVKHALADLHVQITMAGHGVLYAAYALDEGLTDSAFWASAAKAKASDVARGAGAAMIQFHGGTGFTWDHNAHVLFKRAMYGEHFFGGPRFHRETIAAILEVGR
jgi:alkylation response protein AidB-like acyl-CoA dehydrogenase